MALAELLSSWASLYSNHPALRTTIEFAHLAPLIAGGGAAIAADRATVAAVSGNAAARDSQLLALNSTHRLVVASLAIVTVTGLLLFATDVDTYLHSRFFWIKMALVVMLLVNGVVLVRATVKAHTGGDAAWRMLHRTSIVSLILWFATTLAGVILPNIG
jgi:hypothetical protein